MLKSCFATFLLLAVVTTSLGANPACRLAASTLPRFKYETTYGWHARYANFTNVGQSSSIEQLVSFYNATKRPGIVELQQIFFMPMNATRHGKPMRGQMMRPDGQQQWKNLLPVIKPLIQKKILIGFMLADEPVWNNISWVDLNATAALVKQDCPDAFLFYNEGGAPLWGNYNVNRMTTVYPHIPFAVDFVSTDDYGSINTGGFNKTQIKRLSNAPYQYPKFLYPKMHPHQKAFVIPPLSIGSFYDCHGPGHCKTIRDGVPYDCPPCVTDACKDACLLNQTIGYLRWIDRDQMIVGLDAWSADALPHLPKTWECYQTLGKQLGAGGGVN